MLIAAALVVIAVVVTIASWITGSGKQTSPRTAAKTKEGAEFGKTTNIPGFCDGVSSGVKNIFVDGPKKSKKVDMLGPPSTGIYDQQIEFCEHLH